MQNEFEKKREQLLADWERFLRFATIATDPAHHADCLACVEWLRAYLEQHGFAAQVVQTPGMPFLYARYEGTSAAAPILIYGHYDVQPVDPVEAWHSPPFEPRWQRDRLYARGAQDNKGQIFYTISAVLAMLAAGKLDRTVVFVIEGEEESGSGGLEASLDAWSDALQAEMLLVHDTGTVASGAPTVIMGLRGLVHVSVQLEGANHDLHSGVHGGLAPNAAQAAAELCARLHDADGRVTVPGFYDGIEHPTEAERALAESDPFDADAYEAQVGVRPEGGIRSLPAYERVGFLPTLEINGIHAGYGGPGMKTVIPAQATIKLSARLVKGQQPGQVLAAMVQYLTGNTPPGMRLKVLQKGIGGAGLRFDVHSPLVKTMESCLRLVKPDTPLVYRWEGASIPIVARLAAVSGATPLLTGFGHEDDRIHAPNESFSLEQFRNGFLYTGLLLSHV